MFPVAEKCTRQILSLPIYPELRNEEVEFVAEKLRGILENG
jgi:dTDP-4-amino-4,6-dideoxygalactose transaminase